MARLFAYAVLLLLAVNIILPAPSVSTNRSKVLELLVAASSVKVAIATQLTENPQAEIGADIADLIPSELSQGVQVSYKAVARDGTITVLSPQLGALLVIRPQVEDGEVNWKCFGSSIHGNNAMPTLCREPLPDKNNPPK